VPSIVKLSDRVVRCSNRTPNWSSNFATRLLTAEGVVPKIRAAELKLPACTLCAAFSLQGMTAHYLLHDYVALQPGKTVLVHSAAGGLGLLCVQWAKHLGARVIGTVSTEAKTQAAYAAGADAVILYSQQDFVAETKRLTDGRGADLVLDGVAQATLAGSLDAAAVYGTVVSCGWSSGRPEPVAPISLIVRSLKLAGGDLRERDRHPRIAVEAGERCH
jgi:NADPH:quinone reductase-like Zn-dependent oxidoreductase